MSYFEKRLKEIRQENIQKYGVDNCDSEGNVYKPFLEKEGDVIDKNKKFVVYFCYLEDELVYIGEGRIGRQEHCTSGCSHVYELNKAHFEGKNIRVSVEFAFDTKEEAQSKEMECIIKYKPELNTRYLKTNFMQENKRAYTSKVKRWEKLILSLGMNKTNTNRALRIFHCLIENYTFSVLESGKLKRYWIAYSAPELNVFRRSPEAIESLKNMIPYWLSEDLICIKFSLPSDQEHSDEKEEI